MTKKTNKTYCALGLAALTIGLASSAQATLDYQIQGGITGTYGSLENVNVTFNNQGYTVLAGGIDITRVGGTGPGPASYVSLCTDFLGTLYLGGTYSYNNPAAVSGLTVNSAPNGVLGLPSYPAPTWGTGGLTAEQKAINNAAEIFYNNYSVLTTPGHNDEQAALQMAVWTALYDTDANGLLTGSLFQANSLTSLVSGYLAGLDGSFSGPVSLLIPNPATNQNGPNAGYGNSEPPQGLLVVTPVPEASTVVAGGLLLLPFALCSLKSFRKSRI